MCDHNGVVNRDRRRGGRAFVDCEDSSFAGFRRFDKEPSVVVERFNITPYLPQKEHLPNKQARSRIKWKIRPIKKVSAQKEKPRPRSKPSRKTKLREAPKKLIKTVKPLLTVSAQPALKENKNLDVSSEKTVSVPQARSDQPYPILKQPQIILNRPKPTVKEHQQTSNECQAILDQPQQQPQPALDRPPPALNRLPPALNKPQPALNRPQPALNKPQPALNRPQLTTSNQPKPALNQTKETLNKPKPILNWFQITLNQPQLILTRPQHILNQPKLILNKPQLTLNKPQLTLNKPQLTLAKPQLTLDKPQLTLNRPQATFSEPPKDEKLKKCSVNLFRDNVEVLKELLKTNPVELQNKQARIPSMSLRCKVCEKLYSSAKKLQNHEENKHTIVYKPENGKTPKRVSFSDKVIVHELKEYHKCRKCPKIYENYKTLKVHMREQHKKRKCYVCYFCRKNFVDRMFFKVHIKLHCDYCGSLFSSKTKCANHKRNICKAPKFQKCKECNLNFFRLSDLEDHGYEHSDVKCFVCDMCKEKCPSKCAVGHHIYFLHSDRQYGPNPTLFETTKIARESLFHCRFCEESSVDQNLLERHVNLLPDLTNRAMTDYKDYYFCDQCLKHFDTEADMLQHKWSHFLKTPDNSQMRQNIVVVKINGLNASNDISEKIPKTFKPKVVLEKLKDNEQSRTQPVVEPSVQLVDQPSIEHMDQSPQSVEELEDQPETQPQSQPITISPVQHITLPPSEPMIQPEFEPITFPPFEPTTQPATEFITHYENQSMTQPFSQSPLHTVIQSPAQPSQSPATPNTEPPFQPNTEPFSQQSQSPSQTSIQSPTHPSESPAMPMTEPPFQPMSQPFSQSPFHTVMQSPAQPSQSPAMPMTEPPFQPMTQPFSQSPSQTSIQSPVHQSQSPPMPMTEPPFQPMTQPFSQSPSHTVIQSPAQPSQSPATPLTEPPFQPMTQPFSQSPSHSVIQSPAQPSQSPAMPMTEPPFQPMIQSFSQPSQSPCQICIQSPAQPSQSPATRMTESPFQPMTQPQLQPIPLPYQPILQPPWQTHYAIQPFSQPSQSPSQIITQSPAQPSQSPSQPSSSQASNHLLIDLLNQPSSPPLFRPMEYLNFGSVIENMDSVIENMDSVGENMDSNCENMDSNCGNIDSIENVDSVTENMDSVSENMDSVGENFTCVNENNDSVNEVCNTSENMNNSVNFTNINIVSPVMQMGKKTAVVDPRPKKTVVSKHQCDNCGRYYSTKFCLNRHIETQHSDYENLRCGVCEEVFVWPSLLKSHKCIRLHVPQMAFEDARPEIHFDNLHELSLQSLANGESELSASFDDLYNTISDSDNYMNTIDFDIPAPIVEQQNSFVPVIPTLAMANGQMNTNFNKVNALQTLGYKIVMQEVPIEF